MPIFDLDVSAALFRRILDSSLNELYLFDGESLRFLFVNEGACRNLGYSVQELSRLTPVEIKPQFSFSRFWKLIEPLRSGEVEQLVFETQHERKDGSTYDVEVHLQYYSESGRSYFLAVILDVTERLRTNKELRDALTQAELANKSKEDFLASMSHDLRTPLNSIIGFTEIMESGVYGTIENARYQEYLHNVLSSARHLLSMVDNILHISALEATGYHVRNEVYDPVAHTRRLLKSFDWLASDDGARIQLIEDATAPTLITADPRVATQIQNNLISNALRHAGVDGVVTVRWSADPARTTVRFRVEDSGPGFSPDVLFSFGTPFMNSPAQQARPAGEGFGLGLYICKRFVEARGGRLEIGNLASGGAFAEAIWPAASIKADFGGPTPP